jgi:hypothetical protein
VDTTDTRLLRNVVSTALLIAAAVVVTWQVLFTGPDMGVNRYAPGRVFSTGTGGPAMQTGYRLPARVMATQQHPLPSGVPDAQ